MRKVIILLVLLLSPFTMLFLENQEADALALNQPMQQPAILIISPTNRNYSGIIPLVFVLPTNGTFNLPAGYQGGPGGNGKGVWGTKEFSYTLDDHANVTITGNTTLSGLPEGEHNITVFVHRWVYYGLYYGGYEDTSSKSASFNVFLSPEISIISPLNKTYATNQISLNFKLSKPAQWIGYSIDGKANTTLAGNTTLAALANGAHSLIVYANNTVGNTGSFGTINFNINVPSQSTSFLVVEVGVPVSVAVFVLLLIAYFKKWKN